MWKQAESECTGKNTTQRQQSDSPAVIREPGQVAGNNDAQEQFERNVSTHCRHDGTRGYRGPLIGGNPARFPDLDGDSAQYRGDSQ